MESIVYVTDVSGIGGAERRLLTFAEKLDGRFALHFVTLGPDGPLLERLRKMGYPTYALDKARGTALPLALSELVLLFRRLRPSIVHGQMRHASFLAATAGRIARVPVVLATRTYVKAGGNNAYLDRATSRLVDKTIAVSDPAMQNILKEDKVGPDKVVIIENGVDIPEIARVPSERPTIVCVGNLHPVKGHEWLVRAMPKVLARHPNARLVIVGEGVERPNLEAIIREFHLEGSVELPGSRTDVPEYLARAQIFALPSMDEGMSNALLEAMAAHLPIITTRVPGDLAVIEDDANGLLVPAGDADALALAIIRVLDAPALGKRLSDRAFTDSRERFSASRMVDRYAALYMSLLARARHDRFDRLEQRFFASL